MILRSKAHFGWGLLVAFGLTVWSARASGLFNTGAFVKRRPLVTVNLTISANTQNYDVFAAAGSPTAAVNVVLTINSGVTVSSTSATLPALKSGALPARSTLKIINNGQIYGAGGKGGDAPTSGAQAGADGGGAISTTVPLTIDNTNGSIFGGGGGGGASKLISCYTTYCGGSGGGGGQGSVGGGSSTAASGTYCNGSCYTLVAGSGGSAGTVSAAGTGGGSVSTSGYTTGAGGNGGTWGQAGSQGGTGNGAYSTGGPGAAGGAGGNAVQLNSNTITWLGGNNATRVKGAVN